MSKQKPAQMSWPKTPHVHSELQKIHTELILQEMALLLDKAHLQPPLAHLFENKNEFCQFLKIQIFFQKNHMK